MKVIKSLLVAALLTSSLVHAEQSYQEKIEAWQRDEEKSLRAPDSWLSLIALYWLKPGSNSVGSDAKSDLVLPKGSAPAKAGQFIYAASSPVTFEGGPSARVNDAPASAHQVLKADVQGHPDVVQVGRIHITVVDRSGKIGLRVSDPESPTRQQFKGRKWYPVAPALRVQATFEANPARVQIANAIGQKLEEKSSGFVRFKFNGQEYRLVALGEPAEGFTFIFSDKTSGKTTYAAGRFLESDPVKDGRVELDFNKAYSPPCAFTEFATCPLAPKTNDLAVAIEAGELNDSHRAR
jgi:uncharacterized protein (DUF1684 family)